MSELEDFNKSDTFSIDIEKVISSKNPKLLKWVPGFFIRYIKRILHQSDINQFLDAHHQHKGVDFANAIIKFFEIKVNTIGLENIPDSGRYIFAANHPQGAMDSMALVSIVNKKLGELRFMVNDVLMFLKPLQNIFVPINIYGSQNRHAAKLMDEAYLSDMQILYYPAGMVSRKKGKVIKDSEWKKTFIAKAKQYKRDIIPVYIHISNSQFFYRLAKFRRFLGIKANIEMFYLVDEVYKQKGKSITLVFGKPIPVETFTVPFSNQYWAEKIKDIVYELKVTNKL